MPQDLVLAPQPPQLGRQILLPFRRRRLQLPLPALVEPATQRRKADAKVFGDLPLRAPARLYQTDGLSLEFLPEPALRLAHEMLLFPQKSSPLPGVRSSLPCLWPHGTFAPTIRYVLIGWVAALDEHFDSQHA